MGWPKGIMAWDEDGQGYMSVPFTWNLPEARDRLVQGDFWIKSWRVGGPAVRLMPKYLEGIPGVTVDTGDLPRMLQQANPLATRTTSGCIRRCAFCGIGQRKIEGDFRELVDWPDLPIVCDNNLLAASMPHFHRVLDRLMKWEDVDFNQGLDARLLTTEHAARFAELRKPTMRLALDSDGEKEAWVRAFEILREAGITKASIRSYVLIGFVERPESAWRRCEFVTFHGVKAYPQWFHPLDSLVYNGITPLARRRGWNEEEQRRIMGWYYKHRGTKPEYAV